MGFFDRFSGKKEAPSPAGPAPAAAVIERQAAANAVGRVAAAREKLEAKDLPGALAIYEELLAAAGDRADVLVAISGDLGSRGHVAEIIELVAPRYDAERHGPATGLNILQAYLVARNADAAQHVLDLLFALNRPELEERLHGFSNAIAELISERHAPLDPAAVTQVASVPKVGLITISKPIWLYGLEAMADRIFPAKAGRPRRIAFAQLAVIGAYENPGEAMEKPEDDLGRLARALPLWLAETFYYSGAYAPIAAVGIMNRPGQTTLPMIFAAEWSQENLRQLVESASEGVDYIFSGAVRLVGTETEIVLRVWEVRKMKERKTFSARWTAATATAELTKLHEQIRIFMEWSAAPGGLAYSAPAQPLAWLDMLATSLRQFLVEKTILAAEPAELTAASLERAAALAGSGEAASLAWLSVRARAAKLGTAPAQGPLVSSRSSGRRRPSLPELRPRAKLIHARMHPPISDLRIRAQHPLVAPVVLERELPVNDAGAEFIGRARRDIAAVMTGSDDRLLVVVGPCSIHDPDAALDFAGRLRDAAGLYPAELVIAMRVYFEKPRTVTGWKGLINDPARDGSYQIDRGLRLARKLLADITALELPVATEFLDTTLGQYYADLVSWGAIGARTVESQVHRELASGLSMPVGFKNRTDGDFQVAIDAIRAARAPHWFPSLNREGSPAILATLGNEHTHLVLRGGTRGPNFSREHIQNAAALLNKNALPARVMVDCSHANSGKDPARQPAVAAELAAQISAGDRTIAGVMLESNLLGGAQDYQASPLIYGRSVTDACLAWEQTLPVLAALASAVRLRRQR